MSCDVRRVYFSCTSRCKFGVQLSGDRSIQLETGLETYVCFARCSSISTFLLEYRQYQRIPAAMDRHLEGKLAQIIRSNAWFMKVLETVAARNLPDWCVGAVRSGTSSGIICMDIASSHHPVGS
jgi:hypothetical protein